VIPYAIYNCIKQDPYILPCRIVCESVLEPFRRITRLIVNPEADDVKKQSSVFIHQFRKVCIEFSVLHNHLIKIFFLDFKKERAYPKPCPNGDRLYNYAIAGVLSFRNRIPVSKFEWNFDSLIRNGFRLLLK
jgi:hypothetical protein